jgi:PKD repeat protein
MGPKAVIRLEHTILPWDYNPRALHFYMKIDGELHHLRMNNALETGRWHHVAGSYDGTDMRLYLDGTEVDSLTVSGDVDPGYDIQFSIETIEQLHGLLDEVSIYDRALGAEEIYAIYEAGSSGKVKPTPTAAHAPGPGIGDPPDPDIYALIEENKPIPIQSILDSDLDDDGSFELVMGKPTVIVVKSPGADSVTVYYEGTHVLTQSVVDEDGNYLFYSDWETPITPTTSGFITGEYSLGGAPSPLTTVEVNVKETLDLNLYYSYLEQTKRGEPKRNRGYGTVDAAQYTDMVSQSSTFIEDTYPVVNVIVDAPDRPIEGQSKKGYQHMLKDAQAVKANAVLNAYGTSIGVGICPDDPLADYDYFEYHGDPLLAGVSFGPDVKGVLSLDRYYTIVAHEDAHTFYVNYPGLELYQLVPDDGPEALGFCVADGMWRSGFCFMGTAPYETLEENWVYGDTYEALFNQLKNPAVPDPEIVSLIGYIDTTGTVHYPLPLYKLVQGTPDTTTPRQYAQYSIQFRDANGNLLDEVWFDAQFFINITPREEAIDKSGYGRVETDFAGFAFTAVYPSGTETFEVWDYTEPTVPERISEVYADTLKTVKADAGGPYIGAVGSSVSFDASGSIETYGAQLEYRWDFVGDGSWTSWSTDPTAMYTWYEDWTGLVKVEVRNEDQTDADADTAIVTIGSPSAGFTWTPSPPDEGSLVQFIDLSTLYTETIVTWSWDFAGLGTSSVSDPKFVFPENGAYIVTLDVMGDGSMTDTVSHTVTVSNVAPSVGEITAPIDPIGVGTSIAASTSFTDPGIQDLHTAEWDWGDETSSNGVVDESDGSGTVTGEHVYATTGIYTVTLTVTDDDGDSGTSIFQYVVVYDPEGSFVTGGGWIDSPEGAYAPEPSLTGKATFGFVSKYKKGSSTPMGNTEFVFRVADLNFHSSSYQWLVIAGPQAKFKGDGTINGEGEYGFMLTAVDGEISGGGGVDRFRIKIWDKATDTVVYDNQMGESDDSEAATALGGGSVVIHVSKK